MITDTFPTIGDTNGNQTIHTLNDGPPANDSNDSGLATEMQLPTPSDATISSYKAAIPCKWEQPWDTPTISTQPLPV